MKLYDINQELRAAQEMLEDWAIQNDGDITDFPLNEHLQRVEISRDEKLLAIACIIKDYESESSAIDLEAKKLAQRKKSAQSKADSMRAWLEMNLKDGEKLKNAQAEIGWRASKSVQVDIEAEKLPDELKRTKITVEADKTAIKEALARGESIEGCYIVTRNNLQVK